MKPIELLWKNYDRPLIIMILVLCTLGTVMLYSASSIWAYNQYDTGAYFLQKQFLRLLIGLAVMIGCMLFDYRRLKDLAAAIMIIAIILLVATKLLFVLRHDLSPARWIALGPLTIQTSDIARLAMIIYLAAYIDRKRQLLQDFYFGFLPAIVVLAVILALIIIQPDFSTAAILGMIGFTMLFLGGAKLPHILVTITSAVTVLIPVMLLEPYRRARILSFLNPDNDIQGASYQVQQSLISLGNGGLFGMGLGNSMEKNLFLPTPHTDFIFSIIGEETGFIGALVVLTLFLLVFQRGVRIAKEAPDTFGILLAQGLAFSFILYAFINAAVVTNLLPTTGLPMPLISYGGSGLVINLAGIGILLNISRKQRPPKHSQGWLN
ncbi:MAG: putative lipid II flippase FtsW [Candidatus Neomarinimicrobiota bacterium]